LVGLAVNVTDWPLQVGLPPDVIAIDTEGVTEAPFTTTEVVPAGLVQPLTVSVKLYVPPIAVVALALVGFCELEVNDEGPVHAYVAPVTVGVVKLIVPPAHIGVLLLAVGAAGITFTVI
jgi:hypothetical protein